MEILGKSYLRVKTPVTTDGVNTKIENDRAVYKTTHLPISAKKFLDIENANLPDHLKHKIEVIDENSKPIIPAEKIVRQPEAAVQVATASAEEEDDEKEELAKIAAPVAARDTKRNRKK